MTNTSAYSKAYRAANYARIKAADKAYKLANKDRIKAVDKVYRSANKDRKIWHNCIHTDARKGFPESDLTLDDVRQIISQPCSYCLTVEANRGLDRLDNSLGHSRANVVPCCFWCNSARNHHFTVDEMLTEIGPAIGRIREARKLGKHS